MSARKMGQEAPLKQFLERKANAALSTSELARRADLSLNTVKAFLKGKPVRETTVQRLNEALSTYVAQQSEVLETTANVRQLFEKNMSAAELGQLAVKLSTDLVRILEDAADKSFADGNRLDAKVRQKVERQLRIARAILDD